MHGFRRFANLNFINQFSKKWHLLTSRASHKKSIRYQWKICFLMIIPQKRPGTRDWINYQDKEVLWWIWVVEVVEAIEVAKADETNEAAEVLSPRKSLLRTWALSNSALFWYFETKKIGVESWNIMLNFLTFSIGGCWGQPMLLFWKPVDETQMSKPWPWTDFFLWTSNYEIVFVISSIR